MAVVTNEGGAPVVTGNKALLAQLSTALTANGWTLENSIIGNPDNEDEYYFSGPNITIGASTVNVHLNIRTWTNVTSGYYNWEMRGARGYDSGVDFENQPGTFQPSSEFLVPTLTLGGNNLTYWFIINDRRVIVMAKVDGRFANMYGGFILPYGTPTEYPFPMYVAGSAGDYRTTDVAGDYTLCACYDPNEDSARIQDLSGNWEQCANFRRATSKTVATSGSTPDRRVSLWPYRTQKTSTVYGLFHLSHTKTTPNYPLLPIIIFSRIAGETNLYGELEGIYYMPGSGAAPEDSMTISTEDYIVTQAMYRGTREDFAAIKRV